MRFSRYFLIFALFTSLGWGADSWISLFDGKTLEGWISSRSGSNALWEVKEGYLEVVPGLGDIETKQHFNDFSLHIEFWIPYLPEKQGQSRGNSGIFLQGRYEIQILDSFENDTYPDGMCGALYKAAAPFFSMSTPPETWQAYDIDFFSPRVDSQGKVIEKGRITVVHNGQVILENVEFEKGTGSAGKKQQGIPGPIRLQDHGSQVRFRNLKIKPWDEPPRYGIAD